jgi:peroxiredoxin
MAATPSTMLELGTIAPDFDLEDPGGKRWSRDACRGERGLVVMFICNHCPFVKHIREELASIGREYASRGVGVVAISSNDVDNYPDDSPAKMGEEASEAGYTFPYLYDATQEVAKAYRAACTPDFYVFDADMKLVYRGQLDDSRPGNGIAVTGSDLRGAIEALLTGSAPQADQKPSIGCNIKWKPGNEPDYA